MKDSHKKLETKVEDLSTWKTHVSG